MFRSFFKRRTTHGNKRTFRRTLFGRKRKGWTIDNDIDVTKILALRKNITLRNLGYFTSCIAGIYGIAYLLAEEETIPYTGKKKKDVVTEKN